VWRDARLEDELVITRQRADRMRGELSAARQRLRTLDDDLDRP